MKENKSDKKCKTNENEKSCCEAAEKIGNSINTQECECESDSGYENKTAEACCSHKTKHRTEEEQRALVNRLSRIEGQVRGIKGMIENNAYCTDILVQVAAVNSALNSFNKELLASHIRTCVADDIRSGNDETIDELVSILRKLMK